jgi:hypothetical protein
VHRQRAGEADTDWRDVLLNRSDMSAARKKIAPAKRSSGLPAACWKAPRPLGSARRRPPPRLPDARHLVGRVGKENGKLLAPWDQLVVFGIGRRLIGEAIKDAKVLGFIDVKEGIGRAPSTYTLTWLTMHDGTTPTNRWRTVVVHEGEPQHVVRHGELVEFTKVNHKARSGSPR